MEAILIIAISLILVLVWSYTDQKSPGLLFAFQDFSCAPFSTAYPQVFKKVWISPQVCYKFVT